MSIKVNIDSRVTIPEIRRAAEEIGCILTTDGKGGLLVTPGDTPKPHPERHGNGNVVKLNRFRRQHTATNWMPTPGPEAA